MTLGDVDQTRRDILLGDHHVHSTFSDDAESSLEENLTAAHAVGLTVIRLTDHVRRSTTWVPEFLRAVSSLRVPDGLTTRTGVEAKLLDSAGELDIPPDLAVGEGGVDAVVVGDHQFPGTDGPWSPSETRGRLETTLSVADALDLYITATVRAMGANRRLQLGHWFSILPKVGLSEDQLSDDQLFEWSGVAAETGTIVEINEKWGCPGPRAVRFARKAGVELVASTDSHVATSIGRYQRVRDILDRSEAV